MQLPSLQSSSALHSLPEVDISGGPSLEDVLSALQAEVRRVTSESIKVTLSVTKCGRTISFNWMRPLGI